MAPLAVPAQIAFGKLIDIQRSQLERGKMVSALPAVAFQKAVDEMLGVRHFADFRGQNGHLFSARRPFFLGTGKSRRYAGEENAGCRRARQGLQELPARPVLFRCGNEWHFSERFECVALCILFIALAIVQILLRLRKLFL